MAGWVSYIDQRFYPGHQAGWDDRLYVDQVMEFLEPTHRILDLGAGRGANPRIALKGQAAQLCGVDIGQEVFENPHVDEAKQLEDGRIPYPADYFDSVVSSYVLEHLDDPVAVFKEVRRVLRPGGFFILRTPNKYHYVPVLAQITPHRFHKYINTKRGRAEHDTFPTFYRANTARRLRQLAGQTGFSIESLRFFDGRPEYLRFNALTYTIGLAYERLASSTEALKWMRPLIICALRKLVPSDRH